MPRHRRPAQKLSRHDMRDLPAEPSVPQERAYLCMSCEAPIAVLLPIEYRQGGPHLLVSRIGVVVEARITWIERNGPAGGVDLHGCHLAMASRWRASAARTAPMEFNP